MPDMMTSTPEVVWQQNRYDSGLYECKVERIGDSGTLTISLVGSFHNHVLHEEPVKLDRQDEDKWRIRSAAVISDPSQRSRPA